MAQAEGGRMVGHGFTRDPDPGLPTCSMLHFAHIEKAGGTTFHLWMASMTRLHGYGFMSSYGCGLDLPSLPSRDEWLDAPSLRRPWLVERWKRELKALPAGSAVPASSAWRVMTEYHDQDFNEWRKLLWGLQEYRRVARAHRCHTPLAALVREPRAFYVSHHTFFTGRDGRFVDAPRPGRPHDRFCFYSLEEYVRALPNRQSRWLTGRLESSEPLDASWLLAWVNRTIDVLGTTERMGDFARATCQAAGLPARLCVSSLLRAKTSYGLCFRGLRHALRANDTRVLFPDGPARSEAEVRQLCMSSLQLFQRLAASDALGKAVGRWAGLDLQLYAMAAGATLRWRSGAAAEWLAPSLGGDAMCDKHRWVVVPDATELGGANASVLRVGRACRMQRSQMRMPRAGGNGTCVLLMLDRDESRHQGVCRVPAPNWFGLLKSDVTTVTQ
jgi:hypothetical protein